MTTGTTTMEFDDFNPWDPILASILPLPLLWGELGDPRDRAVVGGIAFAIACDPQQPRGTFAGTVLEMLGARARSASLAEERARLEALRQTVSVHMHTLDDLRKKVIRVLALAKTLASVRERVQQLEGAR